jgi:hypothetical protein
MLESDPGPIYNESGIVKDEPVEDRILVVEVGKKSGKRMRQVEVFVPTLKEIERRRRADAMLKKEEQDQSLGQQQLQVSSFNSFKIWPILINNFAIPRLIARRKRKWKRSWPNLKMCAHAIYPIYHDTNYHEAKS